MPIRNVTIRRKRGQARYKYAPCRDFLKAVASLKAGESKRSNALWMLRTANIFQVLVFVRLCCTCTCERRHCFSVANFCVSDGLFQSLLITPAQTDDGWQIFSTHIKCAKFDPLLLISVPLFCKMAPARSCHFSQAQDCFMQVATTGCGLVLARCASHKRRLI